jgi:hypothetical protein
VVSVHARTCVSLRACVRASLSVANDRGACVHASSFVCFCAHSHADESYALLEVIRIFPLQLIRILFVLTSCPYEYGEFGRLEKWSSLAVASAVYVFVYPIGIPLFSKPLRA